MAIPGYQDLMLPLLKLTADGNEHSVKEAMETLAGQLAISQEDQELLLPSGTQTRFYNRTTWAVTYLTKSLLLTKTGRGRFRIGERGRQVLSLNVQRVDNAFLQQYPEYQAFKTKKKDAPCGGETDTTGGVPPEEITPEEQLAEAYTELREALADELLRRIREGTPKFFEHLVVRVLTAMGYGGGQVDYAEVTGQSGDDGIDGVIREDRLGLDMVYVQAKKWDSSVGPGEIDKFVGSLMRKKAHKGVFITSGTFTDGARRAAHEAAVKVRLIAGDELTDLMIDFNVGVAAADTYVIKKVDNDFFEEVF